MKLVDRARNLLLTPGTEWPVIAQEAPTPQELYTGYACIVAAVPAVAAFVGLSLVGFDLMGRHVRVGLLAGFGSMLTHYVLTLLAVYLWSLLIDAIAPNFGGDKDPAQALKLAVYSATAAWLAGVFSLIPALSGLGVLGLYSLYLFYVGAPVLMKVPPDKALGYTAVCVLAGVVISVVVGAVSAMFMPGMGMQF